MGGGEGWGSGVAPLMKIRSVFGTCMVSGIRRRETGDLPGGVGVRVESDGSKGLEKRA